MSTGMEHSGECSHGRPTEAVSDMIGDTCLMLYLGNLHYLGNLYKNMTLQISWKSPLSIMKNMHNKLEGDTSG
jgi:hypothetical protein